jgi:hypothetical protein
VHFNFLEYRSDRIDSVFKAILEGIASKSYRKLFESYSIALELRVGVGFLTVSLNFDIITEK